MSSWLCSTLYRSVGRYRLIDSISFILQNYLASLNSTAIFSGPSLFSFSWNLLFDCSNNDINAISHLLRLQWPLNRHHLHCHHIRLYTSRHSRSFQSPLLRIRAPGISALYLPFRLPKNIGKLNASSKSFWRILNKGRESKRNWLNGQRRRTGKLFIFCFCFCDNFL